MLKKKPRSKKAPQKMVALCKKQNQLGVQLVEGHHTNKQAFKKKLRRQGYTVKHVYIS